MVIDTVERLSPSIDNAMYPQADPEGFQPLQMLMQTTITIECGQELETKLTMHEEILRCNSKKLGQVYAKAKPMREQYKKSQTVCDKLATFVFPEVTPQQFEKNSLEEEAKPFIVGVYEKYPMREYESALQKTIDKEVEEQLGQKNNVKPAIPGAKRRSPAETTHELSLPARLALLKPRGVQAVAEKVFAILHKIKKKECAKAEEDEVRAAAHQRLLLPGVDEKVVRSLVQYIYQGMLHYQDVEQLYAVMELAGKLGVEALYEICLTKLYMSASDSINNALNNAIPLRSLLGYGPGPTDDVVGVVFKHVIEDQNTPRRLQNLVVESFAVCLDNELWLQVKPLITHGMALQLIESMIEQHQVKTELYDQASIKSESEEAAAHTD